MAQQTNKQTKKKLKTKEFEEILPTFCHGTRVKPWKFEKKKKKLQKIIVRLTRELCWKLLKTQNSQISNLNLTG